MKVIRDERLSAKSTLSIDCVSPTTPLRLAVAAALAFPDRSMTESGLRREHARGRLIVERIAGKLYTTLADIQKMRELCREKTEHLDFGCEQQAKAAEPLGTSSTRDAKSPQAALRMKLSAQKPPSPRTSAQNIVPRAKSGTSKKSP